MLLLAPNAAQARLATWLELDVTQDSERVAAARLADAVADAISPERPPRPATERQIAFGATIGLDLTGETAGVASARIEDELQARSRAAIERMALEPGDLVMVEGDDEIYEVSSIDRRTLRLWFKGGGGKGAWATRVRKLQNDD